MSRLLCTLVVSSLLALPAIIQAEVITVLQTGQTTCSDLAGRNVGCAGSGQDGDVRAGKGWDSARFTANADGSYTDSATGLVWAGDADIVRSRKPAFDSDNVAEGKVSWRHALDFVKSLNAEKYLGHNDWRLPTITELNSLLISEGNPSFWFKSAGFANVGDNGYWSSTTFAENGALAWCVDMGDGRTFYSNKNGTGPALQHVWPVRGTSVSLAATGQTKSFEPGDDGDLKTGVKAPSPRFSDLGDSTLHDRLTGLIWTKDANAPAPTSCAPRRTKTWEEALGYVKCLNKSRYLGHDDWRLPNRNELYSLLNFGSNAPQSTLLKSGFVYVMKGGNYWSSTSPVYGAFGLFLDVASGSIDYRLKTMRYFVWPVRGGWGTEPGKYNLVANLTGNGAITVTTGMSTTVCTAGTGTCSYPVAQGEAAALSATPAEGYTFAGWSGTCTAVSGPCRITMDGPAHVTATFKPVAQ